MDKKNKTRKEIREMKEKFDIGCELIKVIKHFFPELIEILKAVNDPRNKSYVLYGVDVILLMRILSAIFAIDSMRQMTEEFNKSVCIENVKKILGLDELDELPHWNTINFLLERLEPEEIEKIVTKMAKRLIEMRTFENSRIQNKYWQILIDATGMYTFKEKHCEHCLTKTHHKGTDKEYTTYHHNVLEAKLVINETIVISIATEFIENESAEVSKQDCERKAFYRLEKIIKNKFKRLPICVTMDSLYACEPVFSICETNSWKYIIRFKEGSIKTLASEFEELKELEINNITTEQSESIEKSYKFVTGIDYSNHKLNVVEYIEIIRDNSKEGTKKTLKFVFITNLYITKKKQAEIIEAGRRRWRIENEGFDVQKNHGFNLEHVFSYNYNAIKNHYYLIQIAHTILQLLTNGIKIIRENFKSLKKISRTLLENFRNKLITNSDMEKFEKRIQIRFS